MNKATTWVLISVVTIVCITGLGYGGFKAFEGYKIKRYNEHGNGALDSGDWPMARFWFQKTLEFDNDNIEALQKLTRNASYNQDPEAVVWWKLLVAAEPESNLAKFGYVKSLIQLNQLEEAKAILDAIVPSEDESARFQNLISAFCVAAGDYRQAEIFARKSAEESPDSFELKLNLFNILLQIGNPQAQEEVNQLLSELLTEEEHELQVFRVLFAYTLGEKRWQEAYEIAQKIDTNPNSVWYEKVAFLKLLLKFEPTKVERYLAEIRNPEIRMIEEISSFLNKAEKSDLLLDWLDGLLEKGLEENLSVQIAKAEAYTAVENWEMLLSYTEAKDWNFFDYYRNLLRSKAFLMNGDDVESNRFWTEAKKQASKAGIQEEARMAQIVEFWPDFQPQWLDLLEEMLKDSVHAQWAFNKLNSFYYEQGATWKLYLISKQAIKTLPNDLGVRNNYIMQGLLLDQDVEMHLEQAQELLESYEGKPIPTSTCSFALLKNGKTQEAYELITSLEEKYFDIAEIAHYAAVIHYAAGYEEKAAELLVKASEAHLLPEEQALVTF